MSEITEHLERELKFEGAGDSDLPDLTAVRKVAEVRPADPQDLDAEYYDTADLRLLRQSITLRRRTGGEDDGWHLKIPASEEDARTEIRMPLDAGEPGSVPAGLEVRVRARARGGALTPVARLRTHRRRHLLIGSTGQTLAEIAQDRIEVYLAEAGRLAVQAAEAKTAEAKTTKTAKTAKSAKALKVAQATPAGRPDHSWTEIEVELVDGGLALLVAVEKQILEAGLARSADSSKLAHALRGAGLPVRPADQLSPGTIGAAVVDRLRQQTELLVSLDPAVRADEPDSVHQMRVAVRCLRSALKSFPSVLDTGSTDFLQQELKWLGEVLGRARDNEVIGMVLDAWSATQPDIREQIKTWFDDGYRAAWHETVAQLDGARYFALLDALDSAVTDPPRGPGAKRRASAALHKTVLREYQRTEARIVLARAAPLGPERDTGWHEARKAAKRARYAGETAAPVLGEPARLFAKRMKQVQQVLGIRQDTVIARQSLIALAAQAAGNGQDTFGYAALHGDLAAAASQAEGLLAAEWRRARRAVRAV